MLRCAVNLGAFAMRYFFTDLSIPRFLKLHINLLPPYLHILRRFDTDFHVLSLGAENGYLDIVVDDNGFVLTSGEYEHHASPCSL